MRARDLEECFAEKFDVAVGGGDRIEMLERDFFDFVAANSFCDFCHMGQTALSDMAARVVLLEAAD
jgi:hypothetical protein